MPLFVLALALYCPGIWWGLPHATSSNGVHPWGSDELAPLGPLAELYNVFVAREPRFNPQYPLFQYLVQAVFIGPYLGWLKITGGLTSPSPQFPYGLADPTVSLAVMTVAARMTSCLMAGGVVVAAYRTGRILWDESTGLIGAVLVLVSYPMFYYARTSNVDMGAVFWTSLGLLSFATCLRHTLTVRRAIWIGICAALATATKDASYAVFVAMAICLLPGHIRHQRAMESGWLRGMRAPLAGIAVGAALYVVASGLCFSPERFAAHVRFITEGSEVGQGVFYHSNAADLAGYLNLLGETLGHLNDALGAPALVMAAAGVAHCAVKMPSRLWFAIPALGVLLGVVLPVRFVLLRFVLNTGNISTGV